LIQTRQTQAVASLYADFARSSLPLRCVNCVLCPRFRSGRREHQKNGVVCRGVQVQSFCTGHAQPCELVRLRGDPGTDEMFAFGKAPFKDIGYVWYRLDPAAGPSRSGAGSRADPSKTPGRRSLEQHPNDAPTSGNAGHGRNSIVCPTCSQGSCAGWELPATGRHGKAVSSNYG
jgi:hypothetical protein